MKFLIKYASRSRPVLFVRSIENITATIETKDYQILVTADIDDKSMNNGDITDFLRGFPQVKIVYGFSDSKVHAINADLEQADPWDILVNMSDDMFFKVQGWDKVIEKRKNEVCPESMDCFLHFNDGYVGNNLPTMSIIGSDYYKRDNYIYYPEYKSFSCDAEAMYVAQARGRWFYFPEILFEHKHPANNPAVVKNDELYRQNSLHTDHDVKLYFSRLHRDFDLPSPEYRPWDWAKKVYDVNGNKK